MDICSCSLYSLGVEPAVNPACRGAGTEHQGGRKTQGNDPGASEKAEYLLPLGELMTLLVNITIRLGTCQKSSRSPDCCCVLALFHIFIFGSGNRLLISAPLFSCVSASALCLLSQLWPLYESLEGLGAACR